jgi:hypothetical protein
LFSCRIIWAQPIERDAKRGKNGNWKDVQYQSPIRQDSPEQGFGGDQKHCHGKRHPENKPFGVVGEYSLPKIFRS